MIIQTEDGVEHILQGNSFRERVEIHDEDGIFFDEDEYLMGKESFID